MSDISLASPRPNRAALLAIILISYFMIVLDISIVITALPKIKDGFGVSATTLSWVQSACTRRIYRGFARGLG